MNHNRIRNLAVELLSDENGITSEAFEIFKYFLQASVNEDVITETQVKNGRATLPTTSKLYKNP